jgi:hypothetical protein
MYLVLTRYCILVASGSRQKIKRHDASTAIYMHGSQGMQLNAEDYCNKFREAFQTTNQMFWNAYQSSPENAEKLNVYWSSRLRP